MEKFNCPEMEIIFEGKYSIVDISFLKDFLDGHKNLSLYLSGNDLIEDVNDYEGLRIFFINNKITHLTFINYLDIHRYRLDLYVDLYRDDDYLELLFNFNANHVDYEKPVMLIDDIWAWALEFSKKYGFEYFICQLENATANEEYYFDSKGKGPWYPVESQTQRE